MIISNTQNIVKIKKSSIKKLINSLKQANNNMSRYLVHISAKDLIQEMIIAFTDKTLIVPNRLKGKTQTLNIISGKIKIIIFENNGKVKEKFIMTPFSKKDNNPFLFRFNKCDWHTMISLSKNSVVHEVLEGPFEMTKTKNPSWIPSEKDKLKIYLNKFRK